MTAHELTRRQIEALLVARALMSEHNALWMLAALDRSRVSPALFALVEGMVGQAPEDATPDRPTQGERDLADRVRAVTVFDAMWHSVPELIRAANQLPAEPVPIEQEHAA